MYLPATVKKMAQSIVLYQIMPTRQLSRLVNVVKDVRLTDSRLCDQRYNQLPANAYKDDAKTHNIRSCPVCLKQKNHLAQSQVAKDEEDHGSYGRFTTPNASHFKREGESMVVNYAC